MTRNLLILSFSILLFNASSAQRTELLFAFDLKEDSTMSDSCLFGKRFFDAEDRLIRQEWKGGCADSSYWASWSYRNGKINLQKFGDDSSSVSYRPVHRRSGLFQYIAMDTVPQWPLRIIYYYGSGELDREEWFGPDQEAYRKNPRINHATISPAHRQETYFDTDNKPHEIRNYVSDEEGNLSKIEFRKVGEKKPFRIVRVYNR